MSIKNDGSYIKITPLIDDSIEEYEYHEYDPIIGTNFYNGGDIKIRFESQHMLAHPSESYLIFEDRVTNDDGTAYVNADEVALTNNAIRHLLVELNIT